MGFIDRAPLFSCPDWWEKLQRGETPMAEVPVNKAKAKKALAFFNRLRLPDVPGNPRLAEACGDWFRDILVAFVASEDPETQQRLVWELLCMVPKKSSKTTYTAGLALTVLYMCDVPNGQMLLIGPSQNISARLFDQAQGMIRLDESLRQVFKVQDHLKTITRYKTGTAIEVKTFDTSIVTGEIPLVTIIDELHELGKKNGAQQVMQQIRGGGITMTGGQLLMITTQSDKEPAGIWKSEIMKARAIRDGLSGPRPIMLPVLYEFPEELQKKEEFWRDRENWPLVLPNLNLSISRERLEDDYQNNGRISPETEQIWVSQHLNIEIGLGLHSERWNGADHWTAAARPDLTLEEIIETSEVCVVGLDGGGLDDLLGVAVLGRHAETKVWQHWGKAWADRGVLELRKSIAPELLDLEAAGDLILVDNLDLEAHPEIVEICQKLREAEKLPEEDGIGMDPEGVASIIDALIDEEFEIEDIRAISQGYKLNGAIKGAPVKLKNGSLVHCDQPMMRWCVGNAKAETRGNAVIVTKAKAGSAKIDPLMAFFNAVQLMSWNPVAATKKTFTYTGM
ncbi:phage terminase large subunit-like protein [Sagittula marina]|uniref:Phage terminase large subunit-like protein n=1 Tax=Sagittula marina TaxID=943940 RepID=A0A7W6GSM9_9RHOB|nr:terminase large subunit [Sagittula marina]MBB3986165.1 phage terminase large subunit-like protein [Sagittula marina]